MNLHVIQMIQLNPMLFTNAQGVSCKTWIIGGMLIQTTDTSCRKHRILCMNMNNLLLFGFQCNPLADTMLNKQITHPGMLHNSYIRTASHMLLQSRRYFFSSNILMKADSRTGMSSLTGISQTSILILFKADTQPKQFFYNWSTLPNHDVNTLSVIFIMACTHGIFKIGSIIFFIRKHTDPPLCQHGITFRHIPLTDHQYSHGFRQI